MDKLFTIIASIIMFIGVSVGAFGAHALSAYFAEKPDLEATFQTAVRYQMIHGLAIFVVAWAVSKWPGTTINLAGYFFIAGIILFSGTLYLLSMTDIKWLGAIAPLGGLAFLAGWLMIALAAWRN